MYSNKIKPKIEKIFNDLRIEADDLVSEMTSANEIVSIVCQRVSSVTASRSKTILSDMLFDLNDSLIQKSFFIDIAQQNKFAELNLRQEILSKYQFAADISVDYQEASRMIQPIKVAVGTGAIGVVLIAGLSTGLAAVPIAAVIAAAFSASMIDYLANEPNRSKQNISKAIDKYFTEAQEQLLNWFDEVENYFNKRAAEIKQTL